MDITQAWPSFDPEDSSSRSQFYEAHWPEVASPEQTDWVSGHLPSFGDRFPDAVFWASCHPSDQGLSRMGHPVRMGRHPPKSI